MYWEENKIAKALRNAGWLIIIAGILGSFILGAGSNWALVLSGSVGSGLSGLLFLGMSEIVLLLEEIKFGVKKSSDAAANILRELEKKASQE